MLTRTVAHPTARLRAPALAGIALLGLLTGCASQPAPDPARAPEAGSEASPPPSESDPSEPSASPGQPSASASPRSEQAAKQASEPSPPSIPDWFRQAQTAPDQAVGCAPWEGSPGQSEVVATSRAKAKLSRQHQTEVKGSVELSEKRQRQGQEVSDQVEVQGRSVQKTRSVLRGASVVRSEILAVPEGKRYCVVVAVRSVEDAS